MNKKKGAKRKFNMLVEKGKVRLGQFIPDLLPPPVHEQIYSFYGNVGRVQSLEEDIENISNENDTINLVVENYGVIVEKYWPYNVVTKYLNGNKCSMVDIAVREIIKKNSLM